MYKIGSKATAVLKNQIRVRRYANRRRPGSSRVFDTHLDASERVKAFDEFVPEPWIGISELRRAVSEASISQQIAENSGPIIAQFAGAEDRHYARNRNRIARL